MFRPTLGGCLAVLAAVGSAGAAPNGPARPLLLTPAAAPVPALKYMLLQPLRDQKPGNAAPLYRKAAQELNRLQPLLNDTGWQRAFAWLELSPQRQRETVKQASAYIKPIAPVFDAIGAAACCESCDWGILEEFGKDRFSISYEDAQRVRGLAFWLQYRSRVALADDRPDDALRDARTVFTMAHHLNGAPTLIHALVATALTAIGTGMAEKVVEHPRCPNLYWALADLPRPFIDLRPALEGERLALWGTFPGLSTAAADLNAGPMPPDKLERISGLLTETGLLKFAPNKELLPPALRQIPGLRKAVSGSSETLGMYYYGQEIQRRHEGAKRVLIAAGRPRDKVEQMPPLQVALLHAGLETECVLDEARKWQTFPYWQAAPALAELRRKVERPQSFLAEPAALPFARMMVPVLYKTTFARTRIDRNLAALRCVEAVRLYAAVHDGRFPPGLSAIKEVPVPVDPMTGKAFEYDLLGDRARLYAEAVTGDFPATVPNFELRLR